ncbi:unnamed protein product [Owenia fusiformis]|uniref:Transporter n=1 Tax=Owenia fusiformis TaxID=6347 RepID=A0A8S4P1Q6_OWEFU|nr:unnamed protein product [Owenia fusiformis]
MSNETINDLNSKDAENITLEQIDDLYNIDQDEDPPKSPGARSVRWSITSADDAQRISVDHPSTTRDEFSNRRSISNSSIQGGIHVSRSHHERLYSLGIDENVERGNWGSYWDFILACLGINVGLGNLWRFPYLCFTNGGAVFLIPYVIMLVFVGIPITFLELSIAQFSSSGPISVWRCVPLFKGIGVAISVAYAFLAIYYNMIMGWSIFYLFSSFTRYLPWMDCNNYWNTDACSVDQVKVNCNFTGLTQYDNGTCYNNSIQIGIWDYNIYNNVTAAMNITKVSPAQEFYNLFTLKISAGIDDIGTPQYHLVLSLLLSWFLVFVCMMKGIKTVGKVVYLTATLPYIILTIMLGFGATQKGALEGVQFYIYNTDWSKLGEAKVWKDAAGQVFFSLSLGGGGLIGLASYNRFHNNIFRDALIASIGNCITAFYAGFVVFIYLGVLANQLGVDVADVAAKGPDLVFVVYPNAFTVLPVPPLWSILFFLLLLSLGLDSVFGMLEAISTSLLDNFTKLRKYRPHVTFVLCCVLFLCGLPLTTNAGMYVLTLMDHFAVIWTFLICGFFECIAVAWFYGSSRFLKDINLMIDIPPGKIWWRICWTFICPAMVLFIIVFSSVRYTPVEYGKTYTYPDWATGIGWLLAGVSLMFIPITAVFKIITTKHGNIFQRIRYLCQPTMDWGPALVRHRQLVFVSNYVEDFVVNPKQQKKTLTSSNNLARLQGVDNLGYRRRKSSPANRQQSFDAIVE